MSLATQIARSVVKKAGKSSASLIDIVKANPATKVKEIASKDITEYIKTPLVPKKESNKNFKDTFKDTTVVDEKNKPRVMYHGRNKDFESFDTANAKTDTQEIGTHIGTVDQANEFATREGGNVVPTYLNVKNPLRLDDYGSFNSGEVLDQLRSRGDFDEDIIDAIESIPSVVEQNKAVVDLIKGSGYDGIVYLNKREGLNLKGTDKEVSSKIDELQDYDDETLRKKYGAKDSYIIFDPTQAKSIFNKGSWSESDNRLNYNKGGAVNDMNKLFAEGGINDQGGTTDPVSGNDVPPGALKSEVRDDIDAKLSEGEFVFSADVVRYIGLSNLMKIRDKAKEGLAKMEDIGQMGNADQVADGESLHEDDFEGTIDEVMSEVDQEHEQTHATGGMVQHFAEGGFAQPGTDYLAKYNIPKTAITNQALDVRGYKNKEGRLIFITFFNGKPSIPIPGGYEYAGTGQELAGATTTPKTTATTDTTTTADTTTPNLTAGSKGGPGPGSRTGEGTDGSSGGTGSQGSYSGTRQALGTMAQNAPFGGILGYVAKQWGIETVAQENANFRAELDKMQDTMTAQEKTVYALNPLAMDPAQQAQAKVTATTPATGPTGGRNIGADPSTSGATGSVSVGGMNFGGKDSGTVGGPSNSRDNGGWGSRDAGGNTGGEGGGDGGGFAKGGLVSKPHNKSKKKKSGIASR